VVLENGISTRGAKAGDSVYFHTSFPITQNNHIIIPVGSYLRGELIESKRPGKVKGRGEFRMRLDTLIFPNGYTVDLNATPRSADTGGKETMDSEGKITSAGGKGQDVKTIAETTATGAGIGAIADGPKGLGIGSGIGAAAGLGAVFHQGIGIPIRYFSTELKRNGYDTTTTPPFGGGNLHLARLASMQSITSFELSVASLDPALVTVPSVPIVHSSVTLPARFGLRIRAPS